MNLDIKAIISGIKKRPRYPFEEGFWRKVEKLGADDCWEWQGFRNVKGYGRFTFGRGVQLKAHRIAFALSNGGFVSDGINILHSCDNPSCCNPEHLFAGTAQDNTNDMMAKGRNSPPPHSYGANHHSAKFDEATAIIIINDSRPARLIAADYGVCAETVYRLKRGETWKELKL